jgi:hypothetical protein
MVSFKDFHDGEFEGIWIEGATAHVFVKTLQGERFVLTATGVAALAADGFCAGNIILDIESTSAKDLTTRDISDVRRYRPGMEDEHASKSLRKASGGRPHHARDQPLIRRQLPPSLRWCGSRDPTRVARPPTASAKCRTLMAAMLRVTVNPRL